MSASAQPMAQPFPSSANGAHLDTSGTGLSSAEWNSARAESARERLQHRHGRACGPATGARNGPATAAYRSAMIANEHHCCSAR